MKFLQAILDVLLEFRMVWGTENNSSSLQEVGATHGFRIECLIEQNSINHCHLQPLTFLGAKRSSNFQFQVTSNHQHVLITLNHNFCLKLKVSGIISTPLIFDQLQSNNKNPFMNKDEREKKIIHCYSCFLPSRIVDEMSNVEMERKDTQNILKVK